MGKYVHLFETETAFTQTYSGSEYVEPWVSYIRENGQVNYNKEPVFIPELQVPTGLMSLRNGSGIEYPLDWFFETEPIADLSNYSVYEEDGHYYANNPSNYYGLVFNKSVYTRWIEGDEWDDGDSSSALTEYTVTEPFTIKFFTKTPKTLVHTTQLVPGDTFTKYEYEHFDQWNKRLTFPNGTTISSGGQEASASISGYVPSN